MKKMIVIGIAIAIIIIGGISVYSQSQNFDDSMVIESQDNDEGTGKNFSIKLKEEVGITSVP